jgi:hypothetical protein
MVEQEGRTALREPLTMRDGLWRVKDRHFFTFGLLLLAATMLWAAISGGASAALVLPAALSLAITMVLQGWGPKSDAQANLMVMAFIGGAKVAGPVAIFLIVFSLVKAPLPNEVGGVVYQADPLQELRGAVVVPLNGGCPRQSEETKSDGVFALPDCPDLSSKGQSVRLRLPQGRLTNVFALCATGQPCTTQIYVSGLDTDQPRAYIGLGGRVTLDDRNRTGLHPARVRLSSSKDCQAATDESGFFSIQGIGCVEELSRGVEIHKGTNESGFAMCTVRSQQTELTRGKMVPFTVNCDGQPPGPDTGGGGHAGVPPLLITRNLACSAPHAGDEPPCDGFFAELGIGKKFQRSMVRRFADVQESDHECEYEPESNSDNHVVAQLDRVLRVKHETYGGAHTWQLDKQDFCKAEVEWSVVGRNRELRVQTHLRPRSPIGPLLRCARNTGGPSEMPARLPAGTVRTSFQSSASSANRCSLVIHRRRPSHTT